VAVGHCGVMLKTCLVDIVGYRFSAIFDDVEAC